MNFGFIITRHVNSKQTNMYWNQNIKLLRILYPEHLIVIIDDNSNQDFVIPEFNYKNIQVIQSEFPGRGELLPYVYYLKYRWFPNAVIIHDSVFIHKRLAFDKIKQPVLPFWHFNYDKENIHNIIRICSGLKNNNKIFNILTNTNINTLGTNSLNNFPSINNFVCCFGVQSYINYQFLSNIENKYGITNLVNFVRTRTDRCAMERIMGLLFSLEYPKLLKYKSLLGNIQTQGEWGYSFEQYQNAFKKRKPVKIVVKVWTGR
jgi:hypothetical protein